METSFHSIFLENIILHLNISYWSPYHDFLKNMNINQAIYLQFLMTKS